MRKYAYILRIMVIIALILPTIILAQVPTGGGEIESPIDGGLSLLLAAGMGYGAKKLKQKRKTNSIHELN